MFRRRKFVLIATASVIVLMLVFPPFQFVRQAATINMGYAFMASPPSDGYATVNVPLLLLQMVVVGVVGVVAWYWVSNED
jgi:hypothetical protein